MKHFDIFQKSLHPDNASGMDLQWTGNGSMKLRTIFVSLFCLFAFGVGSAWGETENRKVTLFFTSNGGTNSGSLQDSTCYFSSTTAGFSGSVTNIVDITTAKNDAGTAPTIYTESLRFYKKKNTANGGSITLTAGSSVTAITKVKVTGVSNYQRTVSYKVDGGSATAFGSWNNDTVSTGTISASESVYIQVTENSNNTNQLRVSKIEIFYTAEVSGGGGGGGSSNPTLSLTQSNNAITSLSLDGVDVTTQTIGLTASNFGEDITTVTTGLYNNADCADNHAITSGAWITNITVNNAKTQVTFGANDNTSLTDSRQCWLKITASGATKSASAVLAITQAKAPLHTMQQIFDNAPNSAANKDIKFNSAWVITGVTSNGKTAYLSDGTKGLILYNNASSSNPIAGLAAGNTLSGTVSRSLVLYGGSAELTGFTLTDLTKGTGGSVDVQTLNASQVKALTGVNTGSLIKVSGLCVEENSKLYIKLSDDVKVQVYTAIYSTTTPTKDKYYDCTGVYVYYQKDAYTDPVHEIAPRSSADIVEKTCDVNPSLGATTVDGISQTGATLHSAGITAIGDYCEITSYGFEYGISSTFEGATHVQVGTSYTTANTAFEYEIASSSLTAGTKYYVRAYATNGHGTAYEVLENGFTTDAATSPTINVTESSHNFNQVLTTASAQTWKFTVTGANLTENVAISGASDPISLSSSSLAYADVNGDGVEVTVTLTPDEAESVNQTLTLSANGASTTVTIAASVVAPYEVTFNVPTGLTAPANQYITPGEAADLTVSPTGSLAACTFLGWVTEEHAEQTAAISQLESFTPTGDANLYALFSRVDGEDFSGYVLSVEFGNATQYVGAYSSSDKNLGVVSDIEDAEVFGLDESGYIYAYINNEKKYLKSSNNSSKKAYVEFADKEASASWTLSEGSPFTVTTTCSTDGISGRQFAYNDNGHASDDSKTPRFALYITGNTTGYSYNFTKTSASKEVGVTYYSTAPVVAELSSIEVTTGPTKTAYFAGDNFDATGMVVKAHFTGGKADKIIAHKDLTITPSANLEAGTTSVSISYGGQSTTQAITVTAVALENIAVETEPTKTTYKVGDTFDPAGLVVNAVFNDVTKNRALESSEYTLSEPNMATTGEKTITVTAKANTDITTSFTIQVNSELSSIAVNTDNAKTVYVEGEEFNPEGIVVTATYTDDSSHEVTGATFNKSGVLKAINELSEPATIEVEVSYTENNVTKTTTFDVTVNLYPRYTVTFSIKGNTDNSATETAAQSGIAKPADPAAIGEYTFAGWSKTERTDESAADPALVVWSEGKYYPEDNETFYAVYTRNAETNVHGMYLTCDVDGNGTNKTIAYFSSNSLYPTDNDHTSPLAMWFIDGKLFYLNGTTRTYITNATSGANLGTSTDTNPTNSDWTKVDNEGGTISFKRSDSRILGWNNSTSYFRAYGSNYPHEFTAAEATETVKATIAHYTTAPSADITPVLSFTDETKHVNVLDGDGNKNTYTNTLNKGGSTGAVSYESSDETIATVDKDGKVTAVKGGTVTITANVAAVPGSWKAASKNYTLTFDKMTASVSFGIPATTTVYKDNTIALPATTSADIIITYSSSNTEYATVDENGNVTAVADFSSNNNDKSATIYAEWIGTDCYEASTNNTRAMQTITIRNNAKTQTLTFADLEKAYVKNTGDQECSNALSGAKTAVTYASNNTALAEVDENTGEVTVHTGELGSATITATAETDNVEENDITFAYAEAQASYTIIVAEMPVIYHTLTLKAGGLTYKTLSLQEGTSVYERISEDDVMDPTMPGYSFSGWSLVESNNEAANLITSTNNRELNEDLTLYAVYTTSVYYKKVKAAPNNWSGEYLIVYETNSKARVWTGIDAANCYAETDIENDTIAKPNGSVSVTIATMTGGYSIQVNGGTNNGKYLKNVSNNGITFNDKAVANTISYESNSVTIECGGKKFRYNSSSGQDRFRYFGSEQQIIQLYKKKGSDEAATVSVPTVKVEDGETVESSELFPLGVAGKVVVEDGGVININEVLDANEVTVEPGGKIVADEQATLQNFIISTGVMDGDNVKSGQFVGTDPVIEGDLGIKIHLTPKNTINTVFDEETGRKYSNLWYCISAPFNVNMNGGFYWGDGTPMTLNVDFQLFIYDGAKRAQGNTGWKREGGIMKAGKAYLIGFDDERQNQDSIIVKATSKTMPKATSIALQGNSGDEANANWNGVANPTMHYVGLNKNVQAFDFMTQEYKVFSYEEYNFVVGTPFFVQDDGSIALDNNDNGQYRAPKREREEFQYCVRISKPEAGRFDDQMYVHASEYATNTYEQGKDMASLNSKTSKYAAHVWAENYNMCLAIEDAPMVDEKATYVLGLSAPKAGEYVLSVAKKKDNADLYLTKDGAIIWNLSESAYSVELQKGVNEGYGLIMQAKAPQTPTDIESGTDAKAAGVQKIVIDEKVFILRGEQMYDVTGKMVK